MKATVVQIQNIQLINGADRIVSAEATAHNINLANVIVGKETHEGEVGFLFSSGTQLDYDFASSLDLIARYDAEGKKINGGYLSDNCRIKAQRMKGVRSEGLFLTVAQVESYVGKTDVAVGDEVGEINGKRLCTRFMAVPKTGNTSGMSAKVQNKYFPEHTDTPQLLHSLAEFANIPFDAEVIITEKIHGTCLIGTTQISMADGTKKYIKDIKIGDVVLGFDVNNNVVVPTKVTDVFNFGQTDDWIEVHYERHDKGNFYGVIRCTPDHLIYTNQGYVKAQHIPYTAKLYATKKSMTLSDDHFHILLGKLLGDGYLTRNGEYGLGVSFGHKLDHEDYIDYTMNALGIYGNTRKQYKVSGYGSKMVAVITRHSMSIRDAFLGMYEEKKYVPEWVADVLNPISIAFWYMDDGNLVHHVSQKDRAAFATCAFSEEDCRVLERGLHNNGITNTTVYKSDKHWRIRVNADSAEVMFNLIAPYVPDCMLYKLPEKYHNRVLFTEYQNSEKCMALVETSAHIIRKARMESYSKQKWDITTETHNFIANDLVVHNSHRLGNVPLEAKGIKGWINRLFNRDIFKPEYKIIHGSRRVILDDNKPGYYGTNEFRYNATAGIVPRKGEVIYGEIVGYVSPAKLIMPSHDTKDLKELRKKYGAHMVYDYGCKDGECKFYVYRITQDGRDLTWDKMVARAEELGIPTVPIIYRRPKGNTDEVVEFIKNYADNAESLIGNHIMEGVVVQANNRRYKYKSFAFRVMEGIVKIDSSMSEDMQEEAV